MGGGSTKIDAELVAPLAEVARRARELEDAGADGVITFEDATDPFFPLLLAATNTQLELYPSCCVAFPRSPTHLAQLAWELHDLSRGRFKLGVASQIRPHIERRFSAVWGKPVPHMRELIEATKAVFATWQHHEPLSYHGDYYQLTLMTPAFTPGPLPEGPPPIWLGALGPKMTQLAAASADGQIIHGFHTQTYLREHVMPTIHDTLHAVGRERGVFTIAANVIVGSGRDAVEVEAARAAVRQTVAFYGSTPAYRVSLEHAGWGPVQDDLNRLSKAGRWRDMAAQVPDEMLDAIAIVGSPAAVADALHARYDDIVDRVGIYTPAGAPDLAVEIIEAFRAQQ